MRIPKSFLMALLSLPPTLVGAGAAQVAEKATPKTPPNQTSYRVLHTFATTTDGHNPVAGVTIDPIGNLYGTTAFGGDTPCPGNGGCGTVFKVSRTGVETVLYNFSGEAGGGYPDAGLVRDAAGNLYGTAAVGDTSCNPPYGCGVVFKLDTAGTETVLHSFEGQPDDGAEPAWGALTRDAAGNLYGTTFSGGASNLGTIFQVDSAGTETVLYSFSPPPDGSNPNAGLLRSSSGDLYGTTTGGGGFGNGTVFELDTTGKETLLYSFGPTPDGAAPDSGTLVRDDSGNLYGTTQDGGAFGYGTVFRLTPAGKETVLYSFRGESDGAFPIAGVVRDSAGNLYGTTSAAGASQYYGTVFKLDPSGNFSVLHGFTGGVDGGRPYGGLAQDAAGSLYGTTYYGVWGKVFELTP
jgi:uncharacterized repeat protein (TIGR03803 family)